VRAGGNKRRRWQDPTRWKRFTGVPKGAGKPIRISDRSESREITQNGGGEGNIDGGDGGATRR